LLVLRTSGRSQHFWQRFKLKPMRQPTLQLVVLPAPKPMMRPACTEADDATGPHLALQPALKPMRQPTCVASANADAAASAEAEAAASTATGYAAGIGTDDRAVITSCAGFCVDPGTATDIPMLQPMTQPAPQATSAPEEGPAFKLVFLHLSRIEDGDTADMCCQC